jgi:LPS export ABC transporter protein LptC
MTRQQIITTTVLTVIALATSWYIKTRVLKKESSASETPQIIAEHIERSHFTADGELAYRLTANEMQEFRKKNILVLLKPELKTFLPPSHWVVSAMHGTIKNDAQQDITLRGKVIAHRVANPTASAITIATSQLLIHPKSRTADTDQAVTITQDQVITHGIGMHADLKTGIVQLKSQLHSEIAPH